MKRLLLLCLTLVWAQIALAGHGIEHSLHEPDEVCVECLALPGMQAVPAQIKLPLVPTGLAEHGAFAVPPAPTFASPHAFLSRAPPRFQS